MVAPLSYYLILSACCSVSAPLGVLVRKNPLIMFMSVELMLNAGNLAFVAFAYSFGTVSGQVIAFFVMTMAAAEVVVGWRSFLYLPYPRQHRRRRSKYHEGVKPLLTYTWLILLFPALGLLQFANWAKA